MKYYALATDYDETLAPGGRVEPETIAALERLQKTGRKLILVTGRELQDVLNVFPKARMFDRIVAENGAVLSRPHTGEQERLAEPLPPEFIKELRRRGVDSLGAGQVVVSTSRPNANKALDVIRDLGLELAVVFNKGSVMILPTGVNKATGLNRALKELGLSPRTVIAIGDAENDHALLKMCGLGVAVQNALPSLQEKADWVTRWPSGKGVIELIDRLINHEDLLVARPELHREQPSQVSLDLATADSTNEPC